jgi:hypothetical protein
MTKKAWYLLEAMQAWWRKLGPHHEHLNQTVEINRYE